MSMIDHVPALLTGEEVADRLNLSRERVRQLTGRPDFPTPLGRIGRAIVWRDRDVDDYVSGVRAFFAVNDISIGLEKARELAARLERKVGLDSHSASAQVAKSIRELVKTGGAIRVTGDHASAVFAALQSWLADTDIDVFGEQLMTLRYRLFGDLQDARRIPR